MYAKLIRHEAARSLAATAAAALLAGIAISGCGHSFGGASPQRARTTTHAPSPVLSRASGAGSCQQWPGVGNLADIAFPLQRLASDIENYGPASDPADSDGMALSIDQAGLAHIVLTQLPYAWAEEIQNQVLSVGPGASAAQLDAAALAAQTIADQLMPLCYTP